MNLYFRELKSHRKGLFFWSIGMIFLISSGMAKFAAYQNTGQSLSNLMDQFPRAIQILFGVTGFNLAKPSGYFGVLFLYIAVMATIHALLLGTEIISKEERDKTSEFLFVKPISRSSVITYKVLAGLTNLIIFNLITLFSSIISVNYFNKGGAITNDILVLMSGLFFLQLMFFFIGITVASINKKPKTSASIATSILLVTFILSFLIDFNANWDKLKYLTPYKYFDARAILATGGLNIVFVLLSLVIIIGLITISYATYTKRDLSV